jgi:hypothetical protein
MRFRGTNHVVGQQEPDQKFCVKCKMVLIYDAYSETIEEKQIKDKWEDQN